MVFDTFIKNLPFIGVFFERTYAFWSRNVALANVTHITLGLGIALLIFTRHKKSGIIFILLAAAMHVVAFAA